MDRILISGPGFAMSYLCNFRQVSFSSSLISIPHSISIPKSGGFVNNEEKCLRLNLADVMGVVTVTPRGQGLRS